MGALPDPERREDQLLLVDAGSIYYPAFHVLSNLATREGFPTGAVYGFARTLLKLLAEHPSRYAAVAFDAPGETIRHQQYEAYKAHRPSMDEALAAQIPEIKTIVEAFGLTVLEAPGYEADDIIATLAQRARDQGLPVRIASGDKDLMQLVDERIYVLKPGRKPGEDLRELDPAGVAEYLGIKPDQIRDYLALVGDSVDNIPGVPGIGDKTARSLLDAFEGLEDLLGRLDEIPNTRARNALEKHADQARLSHELVELASVPLEAEALAECEVAEPDWERLRERFEALEFRSLLKELNLDEAGPSPEPELEVTIVTEPEALEDLVEHLRRAETVALDLETSSPDDLTADIVGIALSLEPGTGVYIPIAHDEARETLPLEDVLARLGPALRAESLEIIGQNLKFDAKILQRHGVQLPHIAFDSMIAAYLLDPLGRKTLGDLAERFLGHTIQSFSDLGVDRIAELPLEEAAAYAAGDAEVVLRLRDEIMPQLQAQGLVTLLEQVEMPLVPILVDMELAGICLDRELLQEQEAELSSQLADLEAELVELAGETFNPNSPKQVARILFDKLELPVVKRTKTGPSTDATVLEELAEKHPLPERLLAYRELDKLLGTYIRALPDHIHPETGRIHTSFNQSVTTTGRLSSSNPNLQNIPTRSAMGGQIREAFVAPEGRRLIGADYSQIELRVLAHITEDPGLMAAFERDEDIHAHTAATILGIEPDDVGHEQRALAKRVNFGIAYGMSAFGLAQWAKIPQREAQEFIDSYFANFPHVKRYMDEIVAQAEEHGYVSSLMGRRRAFATLDARAKREAINMPIQGTAADIMKLAMIRVHERIEAGEIEADMLLQIHDELILEADEAKAQDVARLVAETMEGVMTLNVPLKVDAVVGQTWGEI